MTSQDVLKVTSVYARLMTHWAGDDEAKPAPGGLRRVQALINTVDRESGQDRLADTTTATDWLVANELLAAGDTASREQLINFVAVREALRAMALHNTGGPVPTDTELAPLRAVAAANSIGAELDDSGTVRLSPRGGSAEARLLGLLLTVRDAQADGTWSHLKACANTECHWAFYDRSRNHGGTWCEMSSCGNKLKNREFRARRKG